MIGGIETQPVTLARRLDSKCYQVTMDCLRREGPLLERLQSTLVQIVEVDLGGGVDSHGRPAVDSKIGAVSAKAALRLTGCGYGQTLPRVAKSLSGFAAEAPLPT